MRGDIQNTQNFRTLHPSFIKKIKIKSEIQKQQHFFALKKYDASF
jgi:hypothetical protein